jgi:thiol-disulfide isomerase/thioredoxin
MELVFVYSDTCPYSQKARPFAEQFAKKENMKLTFYKNGTDITPRKYNRREHPILYFVENDEIRGQVKGFASDEDQVHVYDMELYFINNPEERPLPPEEKD